MAGATGLMKLVAVADAGALIKLREAAGLVVAGIGGVFAARRFRSGQSLEREMGHLVDTDAGMPLDATTARW
ncbi:MAG: hypothetical protein M3Y91_09450 [Actinomycetota bacterium]|nr:hypothetical protein [Actinomycetota bacterium]